MRIERIESERLCEHYDIIKEEGLPDIYVFPKELSNTYALCAVKCGSLDCSVKLHNGDICEFPEGCAHFLEHKMFENIDGGDVYELFCKYGADANAYTSYDRTVYYFNCTENFEENFKILLDMMVSPSFTSESVDREKKIIEQEILAHEDDPDDVCYANMLRTLYKNNPVRHNICGSVSSIQKITPEVLMDYYKIFYQPENMAIIVCGNVNSIKVFDIVKSYMPCFRKIEFERIIKEEKVNDMQTVECHMQTSMPQFCIGYRYCEKVTDPELLRVYDIALTILELMLFSTSGELYNELYDKKMITCSLSDWHICDERVFMLEIHGCAENPYEVYEYITSYIKNKINSGLSIDDFVRCKRVVLSDFITHFDSTEEISSSLVTSAFDNLNIFDDGHVILNISIDDVSNLAKKMFDERFSALSVVMPL